jgi:hypothetical protein
LERAKGIEPSYAAWEVYGVDASMAPAVPPRPENAAANLLNAIQYVRQMAFGVQLTECNTLLSWHCSFLRKSSYAGLDEEQELRRRFSPVSAEDAARWEIMPRENDPRLP